MALGRKRRQQTSIVVSRLLLLGEEGNTSEVKNNKSFQKILVFTIFILGEIHLSEVFLINYPFVGKEGRQYKGCN
uniref:Uncharacterized protein n=1 Tax=Nelumbo nucifera TaxID=4432 RepID=A0A822XFZ6_NELNU|nr:TPA_asm: hypothetical protein HUJ06_021877 [Nelumbo nucifera]